MRSLQIARRRCPPCYAWKNLLKLWFFKFHLRVDIYCNSFTIIHLLNDKIGFISNHYLQWIMKVYWKNYSLLPINNKIKNDQLQTMCLVVQYLYLNIQNFGIHIIKNTRCYQDHTKLIKEMAMLKKLQMIHGSIIYFLI